MEHSRKTEVSFFASKGLETFHTFAVPYVNTAIEMHETPVKSQEVLRRIVFRGKLVQCVTVIHVVFLCNMLGKKKSSMQKKTAGSAAGSTSAL